MDVGVHAHAGMQSLVRLRCVSATRFIALTGHSSLGNTLKSPSPLEFLHRKRLLTRPPTRQCPQSSVEGRLSLGGVR